MGRTSKMSFAIRMTDEPDEAIRNAVLGPLVAYNHARTGRNDHRPLVLAIEDADKHVVGGLWGRTGYDWLFVELLFVPESFRGRGIGVTSCHERRVRQLPVGVTAHGLIPSSFRLESSMSVSGTRALANSKTTQSGRRGIL
jgi:hypothetical protein